MTLQERMEEANTRVEKLIWLPGAMTSGSVVEALKGAIVDDLYDGNNQQVLSKLPKLKPLFEPEDVPDEDWISEVLYGAEGFLAEIARPVPTDFHGDKDTHTFSWGYYSRKWVHVDSMEELAKLSEAFSDEVVDRAYAKHLAKVAAA